MADACGSARASHAGLSFSLRSQLGRHDQSIVCFWPISEVAARLVEVRIVGYSGPDLLTLSFSRFDPQLTKTDASQSLIRCARYAGLPGGERGWGSFFHGAPCAAISAGLATRIISSGPNVRAGARLQLPATRRMCPAQNGSRNSRRLILPTGVLGSGSSRTTTRPGFL